MKPIKIISLSNLQLLCIIIVIQIHNLIGLYFSENHYDIV